MILLAAVAALLPCAAPAGAADFGALFVRDLKGQALEAGKARLLTNLVIADLEGTGKFTKLYTQNELEEMLAQQADRQKLDMSCDTTKCMIEAANALGADRVLSGDVGRLGDTFVVTLAIYNRESGGTEKRLTRTCACGEGELVGQIAGYAREIFGLEAPAAGAGTSREGINPSPTTGSGTTGSGTGGSGTGGSGTTGSGTTGSGTARSGTTGSGTGVGAGLIPAQPSAGSSWTDPATGMEFVWVPRGCFRMGSPDSEKDHQADESPVHEVCVDGFWMGKAEVTVGQFRAFVTETGYTTDAERDAFGQKGCWSMKPDKSGWEYVDGRDWRDPGFNQRDDFPVACVSWNDVAEYVKWAQRKSGKTVLLPTEAQWEYAARGGKTTARFWGDDPNQACAYANVADQTNDVVNFNPKHECRDGYTFAAPVKSFRPNGFGLYDMIGNVWEWCADWYGEKYYSESPRNNPTGPSTGAGRVIRGGSWGHVPGRARAAYRGRNVPGSRAGDLGFRLVAPPGQR